jgi:hypothetical protein
MTDSTTTAAAWRRPAAPDRHPPKGPVSVTLFPFAGRRPASTGHHHAATVAADTII